MPGDVRLYFKCVLCSKRTKRYERRRVNKEVRKFLRTKFLTDSTENDIICNKCRHKYSEKTVTKQHNAVTNHNDGFQPPVKKSRLPSSPPSVSLPVPSTSKSHAYCFLCKRAGPKLIVVSSECRTSVFVSDNILIPAGSRCCPGHIIDGTLKSESLQKLKTTDHAFVNRTEILDMLQRMRAICQKQHNIRLDFDDSKSLSDSDYMSLIGLSKDNFKNMCDSTGHLIKNTSARSPRTSMAIFLCKLKSGMSNKFLATLFHISISSICRAISTARKATMARFVPDNLGFNHVTREEVKREHTRPLAQTLFGSIGQPEVILVLDGTYIYIEKSNNFHFQRRSYSMHKGRPLVKPMVIVTTTGYYISIIGPYLADYKNNDASILNHILKTNIENIRSWIKEDDIFVVDRGFRDSISLLEDLGIKAEMPRFLSKGQKQMSTEDANLSRLVTKVRWVVESSNARIKNWKYLDHTLPTNQVPNIGDYIRIVCAISNKYFRPLSACIDSERDQAEAAKMLHLSRQINSLKQYVDDNDLSRKTACWKASDDSDLHDFPVLDEEQLRNITCGTYQLKMSPSYIQEHIDGESDIYIHKEDHGFIRVKIQSRHTSSRKYFLWIKYNAVDIESWYCKCRAGARVVGVCSHVAAILWYLGNARHADRPSFGVRDWGKSVLHAQCFPELIDASDSDSSASVIEE